MQAKTDIVPSTIGQARRPPVIVIESAGTGADAYPIEVGFVMPHRATMCTLIRPLPEWAAWDASEESRHGISRAVLVDHGRDVVAVVDLLDKHLAGQLVYSDDRLTAFSLLRTLYIAAGRLPTFQLASVHCLLERSDEAVWNAKKAHVTERIGARRWRASNEALILQMTACELRAEGGWARPKTFTHPPIWRRLIREEALAA
jgi:hypothetical protein